MWKHIWQKDGQKNSTHDSARYRVKPNVLRPVPRNTAQPEEPQDSTRSKKEQEQYDEKIHSQVAIGQQAEEYPEQCCDSQSVAEIRRPYREWRSASVLCTYHLSTTGKSAHNLYLYSSIYTTLRRIVPSRQRLQYLEGQIRA